MFDRILNVTLSTTGVSPTRVTQGNLEIPLPPCSFDSHAKMTRRNLELTIGPQFPLRTHVLRSKSEKV